MKRFIIKHFPRIVTAKNRLVNYFAHYRFKNLSTEIVFEKIFKENHWRDGESVSGTGSNQKQTQAVVNHLNSIIEKLSIKTMLDIPCGDFNWMRNVNLKNVDYTGADIVHELIKFNNTKFASDTIKFQQANILISNLPATDLIFCRDCFVHLSFKDIAEAIQSIKKSGSKYFMSTTFTQHKNYDIITGDWRPINLERSPFNFPKPIVVLKEYCEEDERYVDKSLAVWRIEDL